MNNTDSKKDSNENKVSENKEYIQKLKLGERVREIRQQQQLTLEEASNRTGLAKSTLSKIENERISPSFDVVQKLAAGLKIDVPQLFQPPVEPPASGRRAITRKGEGQPQPSPTYEHELLGTELSNKKMVPFKSTIRARSFSNFNGWVRHSGEEFLLVLKGSIEFHSEFYEPAVLNEGDSMYYDSGMGHACVSISPEDAEILWICTPFSIADKLSLSEA